MGKKERKKEQLMLKGRDGKADEPTSLRTQETEIVVLAPEKGRSF